MAVTNNEQRGLIKIIETDAYDRNMKNDDYFEIFAAANVLKKYCLSDEEVESGVCGKGGDGGCDGIFIFLNDELLNNDKIEELTSKSCGNSYKNAELELVVFQTKNQTKGFSESVVVKWKEIFSDLLLGESMENEDSYAEDVVERFACFRKIADFLFGKANIIFNFYYVNLGTEKPNVKVNAKVTSLKKAITKTYGSSCVNCSFVNSNDLYKYYSSSANIDAFLKIDQHFDEGDNLVVLSKLSDFYQLLLDEKKKLRKDLFDANVRDYQGHNVANAEIEKTLHEDEKNQFWIFNNGITILVSDDVTITAKKAKLASPSIVNGLQTSREIYNYFSKCPERLKKDKRSVLIRIIKPHSNELRLKIIKSTNNQTSIPKAFLRGTDKIHLAIETYFLGKKLYYDRRKNYYKNEGKRVSEIISIPFLAQCLISIVKAQPDYARARPSTVLENDDLYQKLYDEKNNVEAYYNAACLGKIIREYLSDLRPEVKGDICFFVIYAVAVKLIGKKDITFDDLEKMSIEKLTDKLLLKCKTLVLDAYQKAGSSSKIVKNKDFTKTIRNLL